MVTFKAVYQCFGKLEQIEKLLVSWLNLVVLDAKLFIKFAILFRVFTHSFDISSQFLDRRLENKQYITYDYLQCSRIRVSKMCFLV